MRPGTGKRGEPAEVGVENVHLAEDAGLLVRYPGRVEFTSVLRGKEVPTLPTGKTPPPPQSVESHMTVSASNLVTCSGFKNSLMKLN